MVRLMLHRPTDNHDDDDGGAFCMTSSPHFFLLCGADVFGTYVYACGGVKSHVECCGCGRVQPSHPFNLCKSEEDERVACRYSGMLGGRLPGWRGWQSGIVELEWTPRIGMFLYWMSAINSRNYTTIPLTIVYGVNNAEYPRLSYQQLQEEKPQSEAVDYALWKSKKFVHGTIEKGRPILLVVPFNC